MGQPKISLKELASVKRNHTETNDDYLNRFRLLKARCLTQVPEHELVEMAADERNQEFDIAFGDVETKEVDIAKLRSGPPYTCRSLRPSYGNNPVEPINERYVPKTYTFDVTKWNEIYDLLVADGQVVTPKDFKNPTTKSTLEKRDLVHKGLNEGRLKFGDKPKPQMQVDSDPLKDASMMYTDIGGCNMVEAIIDVVENLSVEAEVEAKADVIECHKEKLSVNS
ncbi:hypothetical protein MTR_7g445460 [Medicago truncatula]|uniref:Uncharacterized protein n=1 Tax=Medicago truncatula TaxID=3880 RepID=A0A072TYZ6_MEDTR|nr:hypothetical protein MTR_7g445460 [Medicago truncatula]